MWFVLAQDAAPTSADPLSLFLQFGLPGLVIASLIMGLLWARPAVETIIKRAERAEAQRDELVKVYEERILPALTENVAVNREMKPILLDVIRTLEQVKQASGVSPNVRK